MKNMHLKHLLSLLILSATSTQAALILYTAEGDTTGATDQLTSDGSQNGTFDPGVVVNTDSKFGTNAYGFGGAPYTAPDRIEMAGTSGTALGSSFTLAAYVKSSSLGQQILFNNYVGGGAVPVDQLQFDFDLDNNTAGFGLRLIVNGVQTIRSFGTALSTDVYYHFAATYANGMVKLYRDGVQLGLDGTAGSGSVNLSSNLFFGENSAVGSGWGEQLLGSADDMLIYNEAMSAAQISSLVANGAVATIPEPSSLLLMTAGLLGALAFSLPSQKALKLP